ncbi:MAG: methyltransferase domain-containing protein [Roseburia sp.]|nr:methyltransferase domain-containing protein [Roseburia sp.]
MKKADKYKELFNKEYLMGPNSVRLLEEMLEKYPLEQEIRVLDLGCGNGLTSLFLAKEANVNVFATDLWISATENHIHFNEWKVSEKVIPIHADANCLPFAEEYFDAIVSIDSFHYFATQPNFFEKKILLLLKPNGVAMIAMPGLKEEIRGKRPEVMLEWLDGDESEYDLFHSREWWLNHIGQSDKFEVVMNWDLETSDAAWKDWFMSKHEYALRDEKFFEKGIGQYLTTVGFVIRKLI